jgi:voltage-gated potassium channel
MRHIDSLPALAMKDTQHSARQRPLLFIALACTIPAFYLILIGPHPAVRLFGNLLYGITAALIALEFALHRRHPLHARKPWHLSLWDLLIFCGALASAWPTTPPWSMLEWTLRLGFSGIVFLRFPKLLMAWMVPRHLMQILTVAVVLLAIAGGGFYWLEPKVLTYGDGLWLAFITGATVGYGDLVPSTPASRVFAVFIVLLGYAVFSVVTASIAALFVGEDEQRFEKELHADIRALRKEIGHLRDELHQSIRPPRDAP